jgi:hypothetical protein
MVINPDFFWTDLYRPEERRPLPARCRFVNAEPVGAAATEQQYLRWSITAI